MKVIIKAIKINVNSILSHIVHIKILSFHKNVSPPIQISVRVFTLFLNLERPPTLLEESQPVVFYYDPTNVKLSGCFPIVKMQLFYQDYCIGDVCFLFCQIMKHIMLDHLV